MALISELIHCNII